MKIYLISDDNSAKQIAHLIKLNSECARLHWSKTIKDLSDDVLSALDVIENFSEQKIYETCNEKTLAYSLNEEEEAEIMKLIRNDPELRATLGAGVVMAGEEAKTVSGILSGKTSFEALLSALSSGKNVVLF